MDPEDLFDEIISLRGRVELIEKLLLAALKRERRRDKGEPLDINAPPLTDYDIEELE